MDVLEINDIALRLHRNEQCFEHQCVILEQGSTLLFNAQALSARRLYPRHCASTYWQYLSLEQGRQIGGFRHPADLAHQQLLAMAEQFGPSPVLLAVPASFGEAQLSLLLGILRETPWQVQGMINQALACLAEQAESGSHAHLELHAQQVLLTQLQADADIGVTSYQHFSALGWDNLHEHIMRHLTRRFIQEQRFDPMHRGETEQAMYEWTQAVCSGQASNELVIANKVLRLDRQEIGELICQFFIPLQRALESQQANLWLSPRLAALPGLADLLKNAKCLSLNAAIAALRYVSPSPDSQAIPLIDSLPRTSQSTRLAWPTHVLFQDHALPLTAGGYGWQNHRLTHMNDSPAFLLHRLDNGFVLVANAPWQARSVRTDGLLRLGDEITLCQGEQQHQLRCIRVLP
ncbi:hypothetical protein GCM10009092_15060 [Bowmanella denitrificans]|uniref:Uncharacterized protein n=1 Tax=Bowmanella denitrificans TaxID=366582 RepID=A0ABP3GPH5_9ALTE